MVLIFHISGECTEVESAVRAVVQDGSLLCYDGEGQVVARFPASEVQTYTANQVLKEAIEDEVCDDVVKVGPSGDQPKLSTLDS